MIKDGKLEGANFYATYRDAAVELKDASEKLFNDKYIAGAIQGAFYQIIIDYLLDGKEWTPERIVEEYGLELSTAYMIKLSLTGFKRNIEVTRSKIIGGSKRGNAKKLEPEITSELLEPTSWA